MHPPRNGIRTLITILKVMRSYADLLTVTVSKNYFTLTLLFYFNSRKYKFIVLNIIVNFCQLVSRRFERDGYVQR